MDLHTQVIAPPCIDTLIEAVICRFAQIVGAFKSRQHPPHWRQGAREIAGDYTGMADKAQGWERDFNFFGPAIFPGMMALHNTQIKVHIVLAFVLHKGRIANSRLGSFKGTFKGSPHMEYFQNTAYRFIVL